jgi:hypothetical protein
MSDYRDTSACKKYRKITLLMKKIQFSVIYKLLVVLKYMRVDLTYLACNRAHTCIWQVCSWLHTP